jgi:hypothetical protein
MTNETMTLLEERKVFENWYLMQGKYSYDPIGSRDCAMQWAAWLAAIAARKVPDVEMMVTRFLSWRLPADFYPDGGISFKHITAPEWTHDTWPTGTNLFHAGQAKAMVEHMLPAAPKVTP